MRLRRRVEPGAPPAGSSTSTYVHVLSNSLVLSSKVPEPWPPSFRLAVLVLEQGNGFRSCLANKCPESQAE